MTNRINEKRILIFTGGNLSPASLEEIQPGDFLIGVERGALFLISNNLKPDLAMGDFDSVDDEEFAEIASNVDKLESYDPVDKDYTDTELAFLWALEQDPTEIVLLGALGTRFDHTLANVYLLQKGLEAGVPCRIIDDKNELMAIDSQVVINQGRYSYVSLLPLSREVTGITLEGFAYPLNDATLVKGQARGVSNYLVADLAKIRLTAGVLLVIKSMD